MQIQEYAFVHIASGLMTQVNNETERQQNIHQMKDYLLCLMFGDSVCKAN